MSTKSVRTICFECHSRCGVIIKVIDGKIESIKGDKDHPHSHGFICPKAAACNEIIYHPERILDPLIRVGAKSSGQFEKISWDKALDIISEKLLNACEKWGPESVVFGTGTTRGMAPYIGRFLTVLGSPTFMAPSNYSGAPLALGSVAVSGFGISDPDYAQSKCILLWAHNPEASWHGLYMYDINKALKAGAKLIVVDPRGTRLARKADHWLQLRPGTDVALALGFLNVIFENELYDKDFVKKWTYGFNRLKKHVSEFSLERCSEITWVPKEKIKAAAFEFANNHPASMGLGMGGASQANDAFDMVRSLTMLSGITGNLDVEGGNLNCKPPTGRRSCYGIDYNTYLNLPPEQSKKKLGIDRFPLMSIMPIPSPVETVWPAIIDEKPYPVKAIGLFANNAMCAFANSKHVKLALEKLDFLFAVDYFHTPTTAMADIILPPAHWTERDDVEDLLMKNHLICQPKAVEPVSQCRDEKQILIDLAKKMNLNGFWQSIEETLDYRLEPLGMTFDEFKQKHLLYNPIEYKKYEKNNGFRTVSKKIELYSDSLESIGINPMPIYREPDESPEKSPELYKKYPLILTTGARNIVYYHSSHRNIPSLRKRSPDPQLDIHPDTAKDLGLSDGQWVYLVTQRGRVEIKIKYFEYIHPKVVQAPHGYWYGVENGWERLNINIITDNTSLCPVSAGIGIKSFLCRIEKID